MKETFTCSGDKFPLTLSTHRGRFRPEADIEFSIRMSLKLALVSSFSLAEFAAPSGLADCVCFLTNADEASSYYESSQNRKGKD